MTIKNKIDDQLPICSGELIVSGTNADINSTGTSCVTINVSGMTPDEITAVIRNTTFTVPKNSGTKVTVKLNYSEGAYEFAGKIYLKSTCAGIPLDTIEELALTDVPNNFYDAYVTDEVDPTWGGMKQYQLLNLLANGTPSLTDGTYQWDLGFKWINYDPLTDLPDAAIKEVGGDPRNICGVCKVNPDRLTYVYLAYKDGAKPICFYSPEAKYAAIYMYTGEKYQDGIDAVKALLNENAATLKSETSSGISNSGCSGVTGESFTVDATDTIQPTPTPTTESSETPGIWCVTFLDCKGNTVSVQWVKTGDSATAPAGFGAYTDYNNVTSHRDLRPTTCETSSKWVVPNTMYKN